MMNALMKKLGKKKEIYLQIKIIMTKNIKTHIQHLQALLLCSSSLLDSIFNLFKFLSAKLVDF